MRTLILGGIRSGKSAHAEHLLADAPAVRYVATGSADGDRAWRARIDAHRERRGDRYRTVESCDLASLLRDFPDEPTLVDDLGNWLTALLDEAGAWEDEAADVSAQIEDLCAAIAGYSGDLVLVSPEVGLSLVSPTPSGRRFADELGRLNAAVAAVCETVTLVVAGRALDLPAGTGAVPAAPVPVSASTAPSSPVPAEEPARPADAPAPRRATVSEPAQIDGTDAEIFPIVELPDHDVAEQARARQLRLTKPARSLGRLEELGVWMSSCQGVCPPRTLQSPAVVVFAGDHAVAADGVSAYPPEVTAQMVANIATGGAAINVLARRAGATVQVLDMAVRADTDPHVSRYKVRAGSGDLRTGSSLTIAEARRAVAAGRAVADQLVDAGADLLIAGDMGIGNTTPAAVLVGTLTDREPVVVVGRGTGIDDATWIRKTAAIRDGMRHARRHRNEPLALLAAVAGADIAAMAGFLAQAAVRKTPALLDGLITTSAALVAQQLAPGAASWWQAGHRSTEPAHAFALDSLGLTAILDLSMRLGEGTGAVSALPLVASSIDILTDMATFDEAGVSGGE
ncbi:nicotinate-nucleotide--dimethylbenzimidazole phosphoribosyltransferase [Gordonia sp. PS3]|uniref:Nicotinate-nucleotide--dimethylbenzimidazole phosphoribosyltransferase n=1 Tax=Gordonia sihwensis NBRC 108236 TaxID=1223544 RepID=L7LFT7_9ACTN|nr:MULTISPECIES: nicotinate-nucleotide--dimethylbenzimidazole phosphoribosyltransferase [Gordonia]AUH68725.1 nicotinate-nucleotide--dimethylbenzimidazole phosphoribosyltransferase [Gordonia sp. YC-JH1]KJR05097.1 nicotinate-nucleotide--dimethylbenzimidazole phosphoribosyltransferase [Gordonia sihwensis]KXT58010.1 nicotinate-nucleotide--dimethylbenzimidazole phosphoribosyltransferase [Gordonia sp. QH-12]MBY4571316.1 nicotinate-nucleotide--dimethylbenzimidazole phosphoribosyltransferase [Gordonia 